MPDWTTWEEALYRQPELIEQAIAALTAGQPGKTEVYFLGFAGDGEQRVFEKEARYAEAALGSKLDIAGRSLLLANTPDENPDAPFASAAALRRALAGIGHRMNVDEDVLLLFLTSHGSEDATLAVSQWYLPFNDLAAEDLAAALGASGIRWRIIVISACFSGAFIDTLRDEHTVIFTAARRDRTSFGCADDRELTYFGEALLRDALPQSSSLLDAFERARVIVAMHEASEKLEPSEPQLFVGSAMGAKLDALGFGAQAARNAAQVSRDGS
jgi:hypothetical protein